MPLFKRCVCAAAMVLLLILYSPAAAQDDEVQWLLSQINCLRQSVGAPPLTLNVLLTTSAARQSTSLSSTPLVDFHVGPDGSTPTSRAHDAGYTGSVGENVVSSRTVADGLRWWLQSPIHYDNMTSPYWKDVGIGIANGPYGRWYTLDFGAMTWDISPLGAPLPCGADDAVGPAPAAIFTDETSTAVTPATPTITPTPLVVGLDEHGYIRHVIQSGETPGTIILSYGYDWGDLPALMELNHMTEAEARRLDVGDIFLVPPREGIVTPTPISSAEKTRPAAPVAENQTDLILVVSDTPVITPTLIPPTATLTLSATPTETLTITPTDTPTPTTVPTQTPVSTQTLVPPAAFVASSQPPLEATFAPQVVVTIFPLPAPPVPQASSDNRLAVLLTVVIVLQVILLALAGVVGYRRWRQPSSGRWTNDTPGR